MARFRTLLVHLYWKVEDREGGQCLPIPLFYA